MTAPALSKPAAGVVYWGRAARTHSPGDPLMYPSGINEYRDESELRRIVDQLAAGVPVRFGHRGAPGQLGVDVGTTVGARMEDGYAVAAMLITDSRAIESLRAGTKELSIGYRCTTDPSGYQHDTEVGELSIVDRARCGPTCETRVDTTALSGFEAERAIAAATLRRIDSLTGGCDCGAACCDAPIVDETTANENLREYLANAWRSY